MPRVYTKRKNRAGATRNCSKCGQEIEPGQQYYEWSFRYGGTYRCHVACGRPRQSELTQSKMAEVYAGIEEVEDLLTRDDWTRDDLVSALNEAAERAREVAGEYMEAAEPFGGQGENAERSEGIEQFADALETAAGEVESVESDQDCAECGGAGHVECETCLGTGEVEPDPDVEGDEGECVDCSGSGQRDCDECGGAGTVEGEADPDEMRQLAEDALSEVPF